MKIICVESNYAGASSEPVVFMKNDSSLLKGNKPYYLPYFSKEIVGGAELVFRISRLGRNIQEKFAHRYYDAVALGMGLTAADLQRRLMAEGKPWEISKAFDGSAVISDFVSLEEIGDKDALRDMQFSIDKIIAYVSQFFTLKIGDLIYTGTPAGAALLAKDTRVVGRIGERKLLDFNIK